MEQNKKNLLRKRKRKAMLSLLLVFFCFFVAFFSSFNPKLSLKTEASLFNACTESFDNRITSPATLDLSDAINQKQGGRKYTIQELFGKTLTYTMFFGDTEPDSKFMSGLDKMILAPKKSGINSERSLELGSNSWHCLMAPTMSKSVPDFFLDASNNVVGAIRALSTTVFSQGMICKDPAHPEKDAPCVNLLGIIGGASTDDPSLGTIYNPETGRIEDIGYRINEEKGGILRALMNGLFWPLLPLAAAIAGIYVLYVGVAHRQFRKALNSLLWLILVLLIATVIWRFPYRVVRFPQTVNNAFTSCAIGAFSGENCFSQGISGNVAGLLVGHACKSSSTEASGLDNTEYLINGVNCGIWKSLVLNTWAKGTFGFDYDALNRNKGSFPIAMRNTKPPIEITGLYYFNAGFSGDVENNLALSWLALMSGAGSRELIGGSGIGGENERSYSQGIKRETPKEAVALAQAVSEHAPIWNSFVGSAQRITDSFVSLIASILVAIITLKLSFFAHVYSFMSTVLLIFAPLFLLFALHYGRGRRIFLSWVGYTLSCILKYVASTIFLLLIFVLFGAVLSELSGIMSLLAIIILGWAMDIYRKEFIEKFSTISVGGKFVSNRLEESMKNFSQNRKEEIGAIAGTIAANKLLTEEDDGSGNKKIKVNNIFKGSYSAFRDVRLKRKARGNGISSAAAKAKLDSISSMKRSRQTLKDQTTLDKAHKEISEENTKRLKDFKETFEENAENFEKIEKEINDDLDRRNH